MKSLKKISGLSTLAVLFLVNIALAQGSWTGANLGVLPIDRQGSFIQTGTNFSVKGSGDDIGAGDDIASGDQGYMVYRYIAAEDCEIIARVDEIDNNDPNNDDWQNGMAKVGLMIREANNFAISAKVMYCAVAPESYALYRYATGDDLLWDNISVAAPTPKWLKITKSGDEISTFFSANAVTWTQLGETQTIDFSAGYWVGLAVTSMSPGFTTGMYSNVSLTYTGMSDGPAAYYPFSGNFNDLSGNGNHISVYSSELTPDKNGVANSAALLRGTETSRLWRDSLVIPPLNGFDAASSHEISAGFWIDFHGKGKLSMFNIIKTEFFSLEQYDANIQIRLPDGTTYRVGDYWSYRYGLHHIYITMNSSMLNVYIDGIMTNSIAVSGTVWNSTTGAAKIGGLLFDPRFSVLAMIDEIRIYDRVLSAEEIANQFLGN